MLFAFHLTRLFCIVRHLRCFRLFNGIQMADPFKPQSSHQLLREAKIGLSVVALLFATLIYVGTLRMTGQTLTLPFIRSVSLTNTNEVPQLPKDNFADSGIAQALITAPRRTDDFESLPIDPLKIEPRKDNQSFRPRSPKAPTMVPAEPKFEFKTNLPPLPVPPSDFIPTDRANDGNRFVAPTPNVDYANRNSAPENSLESQLRPKRSDSTNRGEKIARVKYESNQFQIGKPETSGPDIIKTPRIPSFLNQKSQSTQSIVSNPKSQAPPPTQTTDFIPPKQSKPPFPKKRIDETFVENKSIDSAEPSSEAKPHPSNPITTELSGSDKPQPVEAQSKLRTYKTKPGDTYWSVSEIAYQDGRYFRALFRYNQSSHPDYNLVPGLELKTPTKRELKKRWPAECPQVSKLDALPPSETSVETNAYHVTSRGETLFEIARQRLNQASRFVEIYQLNQNSLDSDVRPDSPLPDGLKLILPQ